MRHTIDGTPQTVFGVFDPGRAPIITVDSGDVVVFTNVPDVAFGTGQHGEPGQPRPKLEPRENGPCVVGPIAVAGAEPGMVIEVELLNIVPADWGWTLSGDIAFNQGLNARANIPAEPVHLVRWSIDTATSTATSESGVTVSVRPFLGTIGLCSPERPEHGWFPTRYGGNMDCAALVTGSQIQFPVAAPGGLFALGDGHARQGDGELSGSAIECPMRRVEVRFTLHTDLVLPTTRALTPEGWVTLGFDHKLDDAIGQAISAMLDIIEKQLDVPRAEAATLASVAVDVRVTQLVNGVVGAHAVLPTGSLRTTSATL